MHHSSWERAREKKVNQQQALCLNPPHELWEKHQDCKIPEGSQGWPADTLP